jgi:hypothetical protein
MFGIPIAAPFGVPVFVVQEPQVLCAHQPYCDRLCKLHRRFCSDACEKDYNRTSSGFPSQLFVQQRGAFGLVWARVPRGHMVVTPQPIIIQAQQQIVPFNQRNRGNQRFQQNQAVVIAQPQQQGNFAAPNGIQKCRRPGCHRFAVRGSIWCDYGDFGQRCQDITPMCQRNCGKVALPGSRYCGKHSGPGDIDRDVLTLGTYTHPLAPRDEDYY